MQLYSLFGIILVLFVIWQLMTKIGKDLPVLDISFVIAGLQWIIGPYFDYLTTVTHQKYYMYVSEDIYMSIAVPLFLALITPYYLISYFRPIKLNLKFNDNLDNLALILIGIGVFSSIAANILPRSLAFVFFLLKNLIFVGTSIILIQNNKRYRIIAYLSILWLLYSSIKTGLFHNLILWGIFLFFIWAIKKKIKKIYAIIIFIMAFFGASILQSIKNDFREQISSSGNPISLFSKMVVDAIFENKILSSEEKANDLNVRLNQGWIISAIIDNVPKNEPFAKGQTVTEAIKSSFLPRFLSKEKTKATGRENFLRFTGLYLREDTSMGISILGEAYANYGKNGGAIFMFFWGLFLVFFWMFLCQFQQHTHELLFFIPLIFLQAIKAESELVIVLNHLIKASIIAFGIIFLIKKN